MRLDKFLANVGLGSRSEVKMLLKKGRVTVDDVPIKEGRFQLDEKTAQVKADGLLLSYQKYFYYLLNKPAGLVSATIDKRERTVLELMAPTDFRRDLFPVGRLDKDTTGLLLLTNDGALAHTLLSPKKHVEKEYAAQIAGLVTTETVAAFAAGLTLKNGESVKAAELRIVSADEKTKISDSRLILHEGKFHQVKRMFEAVGMRVTALKRLRMGSLVLPEDLPLGSYRPLSSAEIEKLQQLK